MVTDGGLRDVTARGEVAGAHSVGRDELAKDGQPARVGGPLEEQRVRIRRSLHPATVLTTIDIVKYQYSMIVPPDLVALLERERQSGAARERLARDVRCVRSCCNPTRLDRLARLLRLAPTTC